MALTNAERQARHRERTRERLRNATQPMALRNDGAYEDGINAIEQLMLDEYRAVAELWFDRHRTDTPDLEAAREAAAAAFLGEPIFFSDLVLMIKEQAFARLNDHMGSHLNGGEPCERSWREHARIVSVT